MTTDAIYFLIFGSIAMILLMIILTYLSIYIFSFIHWLMQKNMIVSIFVGLALNIFIVVYCLIKN